MPVNENSYQNGKVYRIWSLKTDSIYVGSSSDTLSHRFSVHKREYKLWKKGDKRRYCTSYILFDEVGVDNCKIELVKNFPCNSKTELNREEGKVMRENKDIIVNKVQAGRTKKEYYEEHKQEKKEYYEHNKEELAEKMKEYYQEHKEEISKQRKKYSEEHKEQLKEYYEHNKKEILEKAKEYYQERKGELNKKYDCSCGGKYAHQNKARHEKTQKHQNYLKSQ